METLSTLLTFSRVIKNKYSVSNLMVIGTFYETLDPLIGISVSSFLLNAQISCE